MLQKELKDTFTAPLYYLLFLLKAVGAWRKGQNWLKRVKISLSDQAGQWLDNY